MNDHTALSLPCLYPAGPPGAGCALPPALGAEISGKSLRTSSSSESHSHFNFESGERSSPQVQPAQEAMRASVPDGSHGPVPATREEAPA